MSERLADRGASLAHFDGQGALIQRDAAPVQDQERDDQFSRLVTIFRDRDFDGLAQAMREGADRRTLENAEHEARALGPRSAAEIFHDWASDAGPAASSADCRTSSMLMNCEEFEHLRDVALKAFSEEVVGSLTEETEFIFEIDARHGVLVPSAGACPQVWPSHD